MPSQRKRIGYLPKREVHVILDKICKENKLSLSKVTGILVEEALSSRGILNSSLNIVSAIDELKGISSFFKQEEIKNVSNISSVKRSLKKEIKMIHDYIDYKLFKEIIHDYQEKGDQ